VTDTYPMPLDALRGAYRLALQCPHNLVRIHNQHALAALRDAIAALEGRDPETVQSEYESA